VLKTGSGVVSEVSWFYYALLVPFIVAFVYVPAGLGAVMCLLVVNWLPRMRVHALAVTVIAVIAIAVWFGWSLVTDVKFNIMTPRWVQEMSAPASAFVTGIVVPVDGGFSAFSGV
jgi:hypothetical protein